MAAPSFRTFVVIWLGQLASLVGSGLTSFALGVWVYQQTGSVTRFALINVATALPALVVLPFAGALVDRWDRRRTMIWADWGAAMGTVLVAVLLTLGRLEIWHVYVATAVSSLANAFHWPAYTAATTLLVPKEHLARAAGMAQFARAGSQIAAPLLAGLLVVTIGIRGVLLVDLATFVLAVLSLARVRIPSPEGKPGAGGWGALLREIRLGWRYLAERPGLVRLLIFFSSFNLFYSVAVVLVSPLILSFNTPAVLGATLSTGAAGMLLGGLLISLWGGPARRVAGLIGSSLLLAGSMLVIGLRPSVPLIAAGLFVFNFAIPVVNSCSQAIWQVKVEPALQGRIFAIRRMFATSSSPLGYLLAGPLADRVFEPLLAAGGPLAGSLGRLVGTGPGRGIALLFLALGILSSLVGVWGLFSRRLMRVEDELPDAVDPSPPRPVLASRKESTA